MKQKLQIAAIFLIALLLIIVYRTEKLSNTSDTASAGKAAITLAPMDQAASGAPAATEAPTGTPAATPTPSDISVINNYKIEAEAGTKTISIPLKDIPALYNALVDGYDLTNPEETGQIVFQLSRITPQVIYSNLGRYYILVNYNGGVKQSRYMLLSYEDGNVQTLDLITGIYLDSKVSHNNYLIAFRFCQTEGLEVYHDIIVVNIREWEWKTVPLSLPEAYSYSVTDYHWQKNELFTEFQNKGETGIKTSINYPDSIFNGTTPLNIRIIECNSDLNAINQYSLVFINEREGFKLATLDYAMFHEPAELYKTEDGGETWVKINSSDETLPGEAKTGITFLNSKTGWISTHIPRGGYIGVYRTTDGGLTWGLQDINIPKAYSEAEFDPAPPVFFSKKDGIILARYYDQDQGNLACVTHDGGESWTVLEQDSLDEDFSWTVDNGNSITKWKVTYDGTVWESSDFHTWKISE